MASTSKVVTIGALILAFHSPTAYAQTENGVTVDPGSPAGKEYALPIEQARRDATDGDDAGRAPGGGKPAPAFGEGVRPGSQTDRTPGAVSSGRGPDDKQDSASATGSAPAPSTTSKQRARERDNIDRALISAGAGNGGESDGSLVLLLGGVAVMIFGVAAGLLLRRGRA